MPKKICNKCGFQQDEFLNIDGGNRCKRCNREININSNKISAQKQKTAHEMKLAFSNFHNMMEPLEEFIEKSYNTLYPNFKDKRQRYKKTITNDRPANRLEDLFLTQLFIVKGAVDEEASPFREDLKEDFYKWISCSGITSENCPKKLAHFLIEINSVLNGNGEKIVEQTRELIKGQEINPWDMPQVFGDLLEPMNRNREQGRSLAGKSWNEVEIEGRFRGNEELGKQVFEQIARKFSNHDEVNFFPQNSQQQFNLTGGLTDEDTEMTDYSNENESNQRAGEYKWVDGQGWIWFPFEKGSKLKEHFSEQKSDISLNQSEKNDNKNNTNLGTITLITGILALASLSIYGVVSLVKKPKKIKKH